MSILSYFISSPALNKTRRKWELSYHLTPGMQPDPRAQSRAQNLVRRKRSANIKPWHLGICDLEDLSLCALQIW